MPENSLDLVTGGAGFIGSHLCYALLSQGRRVRVIDDLSTGSRENLAQAESRFGDRLEFIQADICDRKALRELIRGIDRVFHQAAMTSVQESVDRPQDCHAVNSTGTLNVLQTAGDAGVSSVVLASTTAVYGDSPELPKRESMLPAPISPYAASKLCTELYAHVYNQLYGLRVTALRYFNVYGPGQDPNSHYAAVIPKFITRMTAGKRPIIFGDGRQSRDFVFVDDVVRANILAAQATPGGVGLNIASGHSYNLLDIVTILNRLLGTDLKPVHQSARAGDVRHSSAQTDLARTVIGFEAQVPLEEGLKQTLDFYRRQPS